jgi:cytochrome c biogenesis protein CcmG, thiol:disulfide interchange protein DsbE
MTLARTVVVVTSMSLTIAACRGPDGRESQRVEVGAPAPSYASRTIDGDSISLASLRGAPVLLNVWATWCHPCRDEIPVLQALHERYGGRGLKLVGVSVDAQGEEPKIREFASEFGMTYPIWFDPAERVSTTFLIVGVPATFLIAKDGTLLWRRTGPVHANDTTLTRLIEQAL